MGCWVSGGVLSCCCGRRPASVVAEARLAVGPDENIGLVTPTIAVLPTELVTGGLMHANVQLLRTEGSERSRMVPSRCREAWR